MAKNNLWKRFQRAVAPSTKTFSKGKQAEFWKCFDKHDAACGSDNQPCRDAAWDFCGLIAGIDPNNPGIQKPWGLRYGNPTACPPGTTLRCTGTAKHGYSCSCQPLPMAKQQQTQQPMRGTRFMNPTPPPMPKVPPKPVIKTSTPDEVCTVDPWTGEVICKSVQRPGLRRRVRRPLRHLMASGVPIQHAVKMAR